MKSSWLSGAKNSPYYLLLLSLLGGLLFWLGWPVMPFPFLLFFAFVPILAIEEHIARGNYRNKGWKFFGYAYLSLFIWNLCTTWWVYYSTAIGAIFMLLANAFLMSLPLMLFRITKRSAGQRWGYFALVLYWATFEYIHLNWDISWPWLTLGNGFSVFPEWVQWYEFTGVFGGTFWILLANLAIFLVFVEARRKHRKVVVSHMVYTFLWIVLPVVFSYILFFTYEEKGEEIEVVVLQPNIDPFTEKFIGSEEFIPYGEQIQTFIDLSEQKITPETKFLVWPETAIDMGIVEAELYTYPIIQQVVNFKAKYPNLSLITGLTSANIYESKKEASPTARYNEQGDVYYDVYNAALFLDNESEHQFYHKSKLVPGVEIMPYPQALGFVSDLLFDLGGTSGGFGRQEERTVFFNEDSLGVAPSICYESIYGDFMAEFIRNGANFIFIITNDGWWGNTAGHKQHLAYATLRAVETRRSIARSANTGISAFINQKGEILQPTEYGEQDVIRGNIRSNDHLTFYARYGDYLGSTAAWLSVLVFLAGFVKKKVVE